MSALVVTLLAAYILAVSPVDSVTVGKLISDCVTDCGIDGSVNNESVTGGNVTVGNATDVRGVFDIKFECLCILLLGEEVA